MCIICLEFNKSRDLGDTQKMIEAARREVDTIPESHLRKIEEELKNMQKTGTKKLDIAQD